VGGDGVGGYRFDFEKAKSVRRFVSILLLMVALVRATGATFSESFSTESGEWEVWNPGAFRWDSEAQNLAVTWDSRGTNAFFYYKLPMTLTRRDDFSAELTLRFEDIVVGIDAAKPSTFLICFGFVNLEQVKRTNYFRGSGVNAATGPRSVVEFGYFPEAGIIDATVGPIVASTNNQIAYSHSHPVELTPGESFRIRIAFDSAAQILRTTILRNGEAYGEPPDNTIRPLNYTANFGDFAIDAFSITSYSDAGQTPPQFAGSVLAHGTVDDVVIVWPDAAVSNIGGSFQDGRWVVEFSGQVGWNYFLERSLDFVNWERVAVTTGAGEGRLIDEGVVGEHAFYRVAAERL
jgi:hypothetical protein